MEHTTRATALTTLVGIACILVLLLCACGSTASSNQVPVNAPLQPSATASPEMLSTVNWQNFTYTTTCYSARTTFHTQGGQATSNGIHFTIYQPHYGDLTGDQQPEAVVPYQCVGADAAGMHVFVYSGTATHPKLLADLPQPGLPPTGTLANVTQIAISHGELQLTGTGYSANAPHCCPDLKLTTLYRWNGSHMVLVHTTQQKQ